MDRVADKWMGQCWPRPELGCHRPLLPWQKLKEVRSGPAAPQGLSASVCAGASSLAVDFFISTSSKVIMALAPGEYQPRGHGTRPQASCLPTLGLCGVNMVTPTLWSLWRGKLCILTDCPQLHRNLAAGTCLFSILIFIGA